MQPGRERIPDDVELVDVKAAIQAAWLAADFVLARELTERYLDDAQPHLVCMRCAEVFPPGHLWAIGIYNCFGKFRVCRECFTIFNRRTITG